VLAAGSGYQLYTPENRNHDFSLDLNVPSELLSVTVLSSEFQVAGAEQENADCGQTGRNAVLV